MAPQPRPFLERFWEKAIRDPDTGCREWIGTHATTGYGVIGMQTPEGWKQKLAHRLAYEMEVGPIPEGLTIDHLCRNRSCVETAHMEVVTRGENVLRGEGRTARQKRQTHCKNGHPLSGPNLFVTVKGTRVCRTCRKEWFHARRSS